jgi:uncharacterized membrane protein
MKKLVLISSLILSVVSISVVSCKKSSTSTPAYSPTCSSVKSYSIDARPIIQSSCVGCHSSYSSYSQVSASASSIRSSIVNGTMPKGSTLTNAQKDNIVCWIDAGTPNN